VVGGYVRKHVTLQISKGLRAVALAAGISQRVYSDTRVIFITIIAINIALAEKIRSPPYHIAILFNFCCCFFAFFILIFIWQQYISFFYHCHK
jgi:hypothetical protein